MKDLHKLTPQTFVPNTGLYLIQVWFCRSILSISIIYLQYVVGKGVKWAVIHFVYLPQHIPVDALEEYISNHSLPEDNDIANVVPSASSWPRLAMLDEPTLLELTGHPSISAVQVCCYFSSPKHSTYQHCRRYASVTTD
jgi:hypothetical protein